MIKADIIESIAMEMAHQVYKERIEKSTKEIEDMLYPILWEDVPDYIKVLKDLERTEYLDLRRYFNIHIPAEAYVEIQIERGYPTKAYNKEITDLNVIEAAKGLKKLFDDKWKLRNQLVCALKNIPSIKKLKDEFPEAYEVYLKVHTIQIPKPGCDSIEKVRAELSKLTKEETCSQENQPKEEQ